MTLDMQASNAAVLAFGPYRFLPLQRVVLRDSTPLQLGSRAREILVALVERAGQVVEKRELLSRVWPDMVVEEGTLRVHINTLRKVLREGEAGARYVESVTGRGYRFVAPVIPVQETTPIQSELPAVEEIHSVTGESAMLLKVRTRDTRELDTVLERMSAIEGFTATRSYIALSTYLERGPGERCAVAGISLPD